MLSTDSTEYELLEQAVLNCKELDSDALTCEIGLRCGGGTKVILDALYQSNQKQRTHVCLDPYGNIEYEAMDAHTGRFDYTNEMRNQCMVDLYSYLKDNLKNEINCVMFNLEDTEFFNRFKDGVPVYKEVKQLVNKYCLVHFDGPHAVEPLAKEFEFFNERAVQGAQFVFDDITYYDHRTFEQVHIFPNNYQLIQRGVCKAVYTKN